MTDAERAEKLSMRRARVLPVLAIFYLFQQISYYSGSHGTDRPVDHFKIGAWAVLSLVLLLVLMTKGFWFRGRAVRELIDDELTQAHRLEAARLGFLVAIGTAIALYFINQIEAFSASEAIHTIVSFGLGAALIRFGLLERRAHRV